MRPPSFFFDDYSGSRGLASAVSSVSLASQTAFAQHLSAVARLVVTMSVVELKRGSLTLFRERLRVGDVAGQGFSAKAARQ